MPSTTLWSQLKVYIPKPEIIEIEHLIGKKLIDRNEELFQELQTLKDVVSDFLSYQFNSMSFLTLNNTTSPNGRTSSHTSTNTSQLNDQHLNSQHNGNSTHGNEDHLNKNNTINPSESSSHNLEIIDLVKDSLTLSKIHFVKDIIYQALINERDEYEGEIQVLQGTMDTESEIISRGNTPNQSNQNNPPPPFLTSQQHSQPRQMECSNCRNKFNSFISDSFSPQESRELLSSPISKVRSKIKGGGTSSSSSLSSSSSSNKGSHHHSSSSSIKKSLSSNLCSYCYYNQHDRRENPIPSSPSPSPSSSLYQEPAAVSRPSTASGGSGKSRVRSKIQAARDEKHFLDEDIFRI